MALTEQSFGVSTLDGETWGIGRAYVARFDRAGFEFLPAAGRAEGSAALRLTPVAIERSDTAPDTPPFSWSRDAAPRAVGNTVLYDRGAVEERYEVRRDGVEQSFVLRRLPSGTGDLVVRLGVDTDLPFPANGQAAATLEFGTPGRGAVHIGEVVGIDARGMRAAGQLRTRAGALELLLPQAFVDHAALPLVVDPLVGPVLTPAGTGAPLDQRPDIAYDRTNDVYLAVWDRLVSGSGQFILGQRLRPDGTLVGSAIMIAPSFGYWPAVGNVESRAAFAVSYVQGLGITGRVVDAATGSVSSATAVATMRAVQPFDLSAGDDHFASDDTLPLVWVEYCSECDAQGPFGTYGARLRINATGALEVVQPATFVAPYVYPRLARNHDASGRHLMTTGDLAGVLGTRSHAGMLEPDLTFGGGITWTGTHAAPEGDDNGWLIGYRIAKTSPKLMCSRATYDALVGQVAMATPVAVSNELVRTPSVAQLGGSFLVSFQRASTRPNGAAVASVDALSCSSCEGLFSLATPSAANATSTRMASQFAANGGDYGMVVWLGQTGALSSSTLYAQPFLAADGVVTDLGGGCGAGGVASASCALRGNTGFGHGLHGAARLAPAFLLLATRALKLPCDSSCKLFPDPRAGVLLGGGPTSASGDATLVTPIPAAASLLGLEFLDQWLVVSSGGCSALGAGLSNALSIRIE